MSSDDLPKVWQDNPVSYNEEAGLVINVPEEEEEIPLPDIDTQLAIVKDSTLNSESKGMLNSLVEMNNIALTLAELHTEETADQRKAVIGAWAEAFIAARMRNNSTAEALKAKLLTRLLDNISNLDLETTANIYNNLCEVSSVDAQQAFASISGASSPGQSQSGINLTINNSSGDGATLTTNTLNATAQPQQQLKDINNLAGSLKSWKQAPRITSTDDE